jgi:drug/metabolite transporter (DMT)-like permease
VSFSVLLLVLLGASLHATWNSLVKGGKDKYLETVGVLAGAALLALLCLPFLPLPARASWPCLIVSTLVHQLYFTLIALSYRKGDLSLVYPVTRGTAPALTALCSVVALNERPSFVGWAGVLLVSVGMLLLAFDHKRAEGLHRGPVLLALANAAVIALYTLADGQGVRLSGHAFSYTCWGFLLCAALFVPGALLLRKREALQHLKTEWRRSLLGGGCSLAAYALALWAMTRAPIASVAALRETSILFGVLLAAFTLKESVTKTRIAAALIIVAGAIVIKMA